MPSPRTSSDAANADGREAVLREALAAARAIPRDHFSYAPSLAFVAPHLPDAERDAVLREAVAAARTIPHRQQRACRLAEIAPNLPEPERDIVLRELNEEINAEPVKTGHALIWRTLLPHLREPERISVLNDMLAAVRNSDRLNRADIFEILAPYLPEAMLPDAVAVARGSTGNFPDARLLACLVPYLPEALIADLAVEAMTTLRNAWVLAALAPRLPPSLRSRAFEQATQPMFEVYARCRVLAALAPHLSERFLCEALAYARDLHGREAGDVCADTVSALAPYLPGIVIPEAFAAVRAIPDNLFAEHHDGSVGGISRSRAFVALAPYLPEAMLGDALAAYVAVPKHFGMIGTAAWSAFVPRLSGALLPAALAAAEAIDYVYPRVMFLAILAQRLPDDKRQRVVRDALSASIAIQANLRVNALVALSPHLPEAEPGTDFYEAFAGVLVDLCQLEPAVPPRNGPTRAEAVGQSQFNAGGGMLVHFSLRDLVPHLPKALLPAALTAARSTHRNQNFVKTLIALVPFL